MERPCPECGGRLALTFGVLLALRCDLRVGGCGGFQAPGTEGGDASELVRRAKSFARGSRMLSCSRRALGMAARHFKCLEPHCGKEPGPSVSSSCLVALEDPLDGVIICENRSAARCELGASGDAAAVFGFRS